jgi:hypothetical protein
MAHPRKIYPRFFPTQHQADERTDYGLADPLEKAPNRNEYYYVYDDQYRDYRRQMALGKNINQQSAQTDRRAGLDRVNDRFVIHFFICPQNTETDVY